MDDAFDPDSFAASPLYARLCRDLGRDPAVRRLAQRARPGQQPDFALFGAVHHLLLDGVAHELAGHYRSVVGDDARPPQGAAPVFAAFCAEHDEAITEILRARLVQTNQVRRAVGVRLALALVARETDRPVHLVEVGASAGLLLGWDRYRYTLRGPGGSDGPDGPGGPVWRFGDADAPVQLSSELVGGPDAVGALPDLDVVPAVASAVGVDLEPIDVADAGSRAWLRALVWPEDDVQRALLTAALDDAAAHPPRMVAGDAVDVLPRLAGELAPGEPRVVFHVATRMHVPLERRAAFDAAINALGTDGPLWRIELEREPSPDPRADRSRPGAALELTGPDGERRLIAVVDGHLRWVEPVPA